MSSQSAILPLFLDLFMARTLPGVGTKPDALVLSPLDNFMHNIISQRNPRTSNTGSAPTGGDVRCDLAFNHLCLLYGNFSLTLWPLFPARCELKPNWDNGGHDLIQGTDTAATLQECEDRCRIDTSCAAFSYFLRST